MKYFFISLFSIVSLAQQTARVDFIDMEAILSLNLSSKSIEGGIIYQFKVLKAIDSIKIDAKNIVFEEVRINDKIVNYKNNSKELVLFEGFKLGKNTLSFNYKATPKQTLYFIGEGDDLQIWTQGQGKYTSHWLPSFDDVNEKVIFNLNIIFDKKYSILSNGEYRLFGSKKSNQITFNGNAREKIWHYSMQKPMSSYLVMLAIGNFIKKEEKSNSGIPLEFYLDRNDNDQFEPTYRYSKQIFDFLESEIGVKYRWKIYRQIPVRDFLYAGMENTTSTIFAQDLVVDSIGFNDRNYVNVNAHELSHQWFGDLVTAKSGKHHWLQEGFATYYALLAEKEVFGENYFYHQLYKSALQLNNASKSDSIPLLNEKASSLTFYQKGAWALHFIRETIGQKKFNKAVKNYLKKYQFKNVETDNFLVEIAKVSDFDIEKFKKTWLESSEFDFQNAVQLLSKNDFIKEYLKIRKQKELNDIRFMDVIDDYREILKSDAYYPIKQEILFQIRNLNYKSNKDLVELAINSDDYKVRQSVADYFPNVPLYLKNNYEKLLDDPSYTTREIALTNLWTSFPDEHENYLNKAKNWIGNNDKGLRIQYLVLTQLSKKIALNQKEVLYNELQNYTSPKYESSIRQNAFDAITAINSNDEIMLKNLINATTHFKWQFSKYAKDKTKELLKSNAIRVLFEKMLNDLNAVEKSQLERLLK